MRTLYTEAKNIRSVGDTVVRFSPADTGITAVTGPNGAGKTTLTTLIPLLAAWGDAKSVAGNLVDILREGAKTGRAVWCFEHAGTEYTVTRTITRTSTGATSKVALKINGSVEQTKGMRATEVAAKITDLLGMGPDEFLATSLIAQGEVDNLTSETPAVVRDQIRKTLGLDRAVRAAAKLDRAVAPARKALPEAPDPATVKRAQAAAIDAAGAEDTARTDMEAAKESAQAADAARSETAATLRGVSDRFYTWQSAAGSLTEARRSLDAATTAATAAHAAVEPLIAPAGFTSAPSLDEAGKIYQQGADMLTRIRGLEARKPTAVGHIEREQIENAVSDARSDLEAARSALESAPDAGPYREAAAAASAKASDLESSAALLDGHGDCPTCGTHLNDPTGLVASLRSQAVQQRALATEQSSQATTAVQATTQAQQAVRTAEAALATAERDMTDADASDEKYTAWSAQYAEACAGVTPDILQVQVDAIRALGEALSAAQVADQQVARAQARVDEVAAAAGADGAELTAEFEAATAADSKAQEVAQAAAGQVSATTATHTAALGEWQRLTASVEQLTAAVAQRETAEKAIGATLAAANTLRDFAEAYTAEKIAVIEGAVNALIVGMPGAAMFTAFRLGGEFRPEVEVDGAWRATHELSGGERAVVGLLLRVGVVAAISGGTLDTTLTADEPLANLDEKVRGQVVSLLSQLPCPVTVISHTDEPVSAAALHVEVARAVDGTTRLVSGVDALAPAA